MMKTMFTGKGRLGLLVFLTGLLCFTGFQARADENDPPTRVARISSFDGNVSFQPGGQGDWGSVAMNRPVTIGDKIWADKESRVELQAGQAAIHVGEMTALSFLNLDQNITQMRLAEGHINFRVRELREGDLYEVDTPNLAFNVKQAGAFRVDVSEAGDSTRVTVIRGEGEVTTGGKTYEVHSGERAQFDGADNNIQYSVNEAPAPDALDRWAAERDLKEENSVSARYVSRDTVGYSDLDDHGTWRDEPEYGHVWYPRDVDPGWAPYSSGYWNWVGPWGWTWVDDEPWGFAPFHYGRWNYIGDEWGWCPGPVFGYPVYGPAFVGFLGGGFGFGGGFGVGWFPLGFGEPFFPWFPCRQEFIERINVRNTFIRNTNILNATNIRNVNFVNAHNVQAVTATSRSAFVSGQAINRGNAHLTAASLRGAQVTKGAGLSPTHESFGGAVSAKTHVSIPPSAVQNRSVMARTVPAQAASRMPVHTMNTSSLTAVRTGNSPSRGSINHPVNAQTNRSFGGALNGRPATGNAPGNISRTATAPTSGSVNHPVNARTNHSFGGAISGRPVTGNAPGNISRTATAPSSPATSSRQHDLSQNRPPSASRSTAVGTRTWEAQGNATDRGHAPQGIGRPNLATNDQAQSSVQTAPARMAQGDRPPWARSGQVGVSQTRPQGGFTGTGTSNGAVSRETPRNAAPNYNGNRPSSSTGDRSYSPPQRTWPTYNDNRSSSSPRSYSAPSRSYSAPSRSYSAPSRSYSAPSRSYSAPSRSYSAPSHPSRGGNGGGPATHGRY